MAEHRVDGHALAPVDLLEQAVWRVARADEPQEVVGTAFFVAPGLAVTCAHVAVTGGDLVLIQNDAVLAVAQASVLLAPDHASFDLAVLKVEEGPQPLLGCTQAQASSSAYTSRGFSAAAPSGRQLKFQPRGCFHARYEAVDIKYSMPAAFELAGDQAEPGFSGAPLLADDFGAVVGLVSGGDADRGRSWAVPFALGRGRFPALDEALDWNEGALPAYGAALNPIGLQILWQAASRQAAASHVDRKAYNPDRCVRRNDAHKTVSAFMTSDAAVLAIVGSSGEGKSWLLADLAATPHASPQPLLFAAAEFSREKPLPLEDLVAERLAAASRRLFPTQLAPDRAAVEPLIARPSLRAAILVDGLNEASDTRGFIDEWIPAAVRWCLRSRVKLVVTTRPEIWQTIFNALDDPRHDLFYTGTQTKGAKEAGAVRCGRPFDHCFTLGAFDVGEARAAARAYGLPERLQELLRGHPLLYRIAARIGLDAPDAATGRVGLMDAYVDTLLRDQFAKLGLNSPKALRAKLGLVASAVEETEGGALDWATAVALAGDDRMLDALLASGLLVSIGSQSQSQIRFQFDDLPGVLTPVSAPPTNLFRGSATKDPLLQRRHADWLLRLEADDDEPGFTAAFTGLLEALEAAGQSSRDPAPLDWFSDVWQLSLRAVAIAEALPPRRSSEIDALYAHLSDLAPLAVRVEGFGDLTGWIESAPLPPARRAALLIAIAPWSDARNLRAKDWMDESRRHNFELALEAPRGWPQVAAPLDRLCKQAFDEVEPILVAALADERWIDHGQSYTARGETNVATMAAGVLFNNRHGRVGRLFETGCEVWTLASQCLISALADADAQACFDVLTSSLTPEHFSERRLQALSLVLDLMDPARRKSAAAALAALSLDQGPVSVQLARVIRQLAPDSPAAFDVLAEAFAHGDVDGFALRPVPASFLGRALAASEGRPNDALDWIWRHEGPVEEQAVLADVVARWFDEGRISANALALAVEDKLYAFYRAGADSCRPWLRLAYSMITNSDAGGRRHLVHLLTSRGPRPLPVELAPIEDALLASGLSDKELSLYVELIVRDLPDWSDQRELARVLRIRGQNPKRWDLIMLRRAAFFRRERLVALKFWRSLDEAALSEPARETLRLHDGGLDLEALFSRDRVLAPTRKA